jgi:hypothetical protein
MSIEAGVSKTDTPRCFRRVISSPSEPFPPGPLAALLQGGNSPPPPSVIRSRGSSRTLPRTNHFQKVVGQIVRQPFFPSVRRTPALVRSAHRPSCGLLAALLQAALPACARVCLQCLVRPPWEVVGGPTTADGRPSAPRNPRGKSGPCGCISEARGDVTSPF